MTTKHSPLPWRHVGTDGGWDGIADRDNSLLFKCAYNEPSNCDFVALAVNSHADLLAACKDALEFIESPTPAKSGIGIEAKLKEAIERAEGKQ